jgi:hypothetical protein
MYCADALATALLLCIAENRTRLARAINSTLWEMIYIKWCCIDRWSWQDLSGLGPDQVNI